MQPSKVMKFVRRRLTHLREVRMGPLPPAKRTWFRQEQGAFLWLLRHAQMAPDTPPAAERDKILADFADDENPETGEAGA